ncbi:hypothetical protein HPB47_022278 [Ixodes persulcatus]|uniref:Uncharacterized protein n=1 Tax=Ixodes persulcatus TaxID=34615 RepID=A0AC60QAJ5_IXOPE|nr:hypothetical protein HPB47_022278 [Ixodes persulcatus]
MLDELRSRTQHRDQSRVETDPSVPDSDKVSQAIRQSHSQLQPYLRGRTLRDQDEMATTAYQIQADILAELNYWSPPPPEACLESFCSWAGTTQQTLPERGPWQILSESVPRALDPYTYAVGGNVKSRWRSHHYQAPSGDRYPSAPAIAVRCFRCPVTPPSRFSASPGPASRADPPQASGEGPDVGAPVVAPARATDDASAHGLRGDAFGGVCGGAPGGTNIGAFLGASHEAALGGVPVTVENTPGDRHDDTGSLEEVPAAWTTTAHPHGDNTAGATAVALPAREPKK